MARKLTAEDIRIKTEAKIIDIILGYENLMGEDKDSYEIASDKKHHNNKTCPHLAGAWNSRKRVKLEPKNLCKICIGHNALEFLADRGEVCLEEAQKDLNEGVRR